jgi:lysophospholipase L1-like esterase
MKFRLDLQVKKFNPAISHTQKILLIGSCFTENIGQKLEQYKFRVLQNPNGILFNPVSVTEAISTYVDNIRISVNSLFQYREGWHSWKHHSRFSDITPEIAVENINRSTANAHKFLKETDWLMITLGSGWIYVLTADAPSAKEGDIAANNHKGPSEWFHRRLMTEPEVLEKLKNMMQKLKSANHDLQVIFTISPVRHIREGVIENNRSKAVLIQAVHELVNEYDNAHYFPAYELVIDDLRDYRFYAEDLVHPNYFATQYVWEKFTDACFDDPTKQLITELHDINLAFRHKPFNPGSAEHKKFLHTYLQKTKMLQEKFSYLDFSKELEYFNREL